MSSETADLGTSLAVAMTKEHEEIDGGIEGFVSAVKADANSIGEKREELSRSFQALRRHIYLEEAIAFPALQAAGLWAALQVMLREHGEIWRAMEHIEELVEEGDTGASAVILDECAKILELLDKHNMKEEPVIYPHLDSGLSDEKEAELREFLRTGKTPDGWVCAKAAA